MSPIRAPNTNRIQDNIQISIAVKPERTIIFDFDTYTATEVTFSLGGVGGDVVEDVDQHQEQGDQEGHPARDYVRGNHEADPGHHHEQSSVRIILGVWIDLCNVTWREIVSDDVVGEMALQHHLKPRHTEVAELPVAEDPVGVF